MTACMRSGWRRNAPPNSSHSLDRPRRVIVGTDVPPEQQVGANTQDWVIWRNADTGDEIARSPLLPAVNSGTMVEPGDAGRMYFLAQNGKIIELTARPLSPTKE